MPTFEYNFPAIRGVQAGREYYVSMCPLRLIPRIFLFDEDELRPELRAQRILNKNRIPEIARYILGNKKGYTFSALTASIDGKVHFEPLGEDETERKLGRLRIPMDARFVINDGQHRRAGIEAALRENPDVGDETISVVFFVDAGLKRCQQMFADLNRYAIRPTRSLRTRSPGLDIDHANEFRAEGPTDHRIEGPGRGEVLARWAEKKVLWKSPFSRALPFAGSTAGPSARIPFSNTPEKNSAFGNPSLSEPDTTYGALSPSVRSKFLRIKPLRSSQKKTLQFSCRGFCKVRGPVHFSARTDEIHPRSLSENMDLTPSR